MSLAWSAEMFFQFCTLVGLATRVKTFCSTSLVALVVVGVLGVFSFIQRNAAIESEQKAQAALRAATQTPNTLVFELAEEFKDSTIPRHIISAILGRAQALQNQLAENFPDGPALQRARATSISGLGEVFAAQGNAEQAFASYEQSLVTFRELATRFPKDLERATIFLFCWVESAT